MGSAYHILGRSVPSHQLAIGVLSAVVLVALPKPWGAPAPKHPPINAGSKEEEDFIKQWLVKHSDEKKH